MKLTHTVTPRRISRCSFVVVPLLAAWLVGASDVASPPNAPTRGPDAAARTPADPVRRVLHLRDGTWFRGLTRFVDGAYEARVGANWRRIAPEDVRTSRLERELLAERTRLLESIPPRIPSLRVEACRWMIEAGLDAEAAQELDLVLHVDPAERHALALLATTPPRLEVGVTPDAQGSTRAALLREGARACTIGGSSVRRELVVNALGRDAEPATLLATLATELENGLPSRRAFAAHALRRWGDRGKIGPLARHAVLDGAIEVRDAAILALRDAEDPRACSAVVYALANPDAAVRMNATEALGRMGYVQAVVPLMQPLLRAAAAPSSGGSPGPARANLYVGLETAYVQDFDVQIAQGSSIADPVVRSLTTGVVFDVGVGGVSSIPGTTEFLVTARALTRLTGARVPPEPAAWKHWWDENRERFVPGAKREGTGDSGTLRPTGASPGK